jgi:hypothetical protein
VRNAGGAVIAHSWLTPATLIVMGDAAAAKAEFGEA